MNQIVKEFAYRLNGREYCEEITRHEAQIAKEAGVVVVFGYSDDLVELRGAMHGEYEAYQGCELKVTPTGVLIDWEHLDKTDEAEVEAYFNQKRAGFRTIEAIWSPKDPDASWAFRTDIPHATFDILEDGELYCRGIVFAVADITERTLADDAGRFNAANNPADDNKPDWPEAECSKNDGRRCLNATEMIDHLNSRLDAAKVENDRLKAANADLLKALEAVVRAAEEDENIYWHHDAMDIARAAIERAREVAV